jgi:hypothetical protein
VWRQGLQTDLELRHPRVDDAPNQVDVQTIALARPQPDHFADLNLARVAPEIADAEAVRAFIRIAHSRRLSTAFFASSRRAGQDFPAGVATTWSSPRNKDVGAAGSLTRASAA